MAEALVEDDEGFGLEEEDAEPLFADDVDELDDPPPLPPPMPSLSQLQQSSQHNHTTVSVRREGRGRLAKGMSYRVCCSLLGLVLGVWLQEPPTPLGMATRGHLPRRGSRYSL